MLHLLRGKLGISQVRQDAITIVVANSSESQKSYSTSNEMTEQISSLGTPKLGHGEKRRLKIRARKVKNETTSQEMEQSLAQEKTGARVNQGDGIIVYENP